MKPAPRPAAGDSAGLPAVLVNPPWMAPRRARAKPLALAPLAHPLDAQHQLAPKKKRLPKRRPLAVRVVKPGNEYLIDAGNVALAARLYARGKAERDIKGWRRGAAQDGGTIVTFNKALAGGRLAELHITPGIIAGLVHEYPQQTLKKVVVGALATLDPIAASELIRDLELLRA